MVFLRWIGKLLRRKPVDFFFASAVVSERGLVRKDNQDAVLALPAPGFFCVADGMGGGSAGELASAWVCAALKRVFQDPAIHTLDATRRIRAVEEALEEANGRIRACIAEKGYASMGSTVASFMALAGGTAALIHVGDSRIYRFRRGALELLTRDHTVGSELGQAVPSSSEARQLKARANPLAHILTRAVGTAYKVRAEVRLVDVARGDRFLLCTDGVHDMLSDAQLAAEMKGWATPEDFALRLRQRIVAAGAGDNYSFVFVQVRGRAPRKRNFQKP